MSDLFKGVEADDEACGVFTEVMNYIDINKNWSMQSKYLRFTQLVRFLNYIEAKYVPVNREVKLLIDLHCKRRRTASNKEYQLVLRNKTIFSVAELGLFLPKEDFLSIVDNVETAIDTKGYKYILGGVALYLVLTNGCRNSELSNLLVHEVEEGNFLEDNDKYVIHVAQNLRNVGR